MQPNNHLSRTMLATFATSRFSRYLEARRAQLGINGEDMVLASTPARRRLRRRRAFAHPCLCASRVRSGRRRSQAERKECRDARRSFRLIVKEKKKLKTVLDPHVALWFRLNEGEQEAEWNCLRCTR